MGQQIGDFCDTRELDRGSGGKAAIVISLWWIGLHKAIVLTATTCYLLVVQPHG